MSADKLPSWRKTPAKRSIVEFVAAVTDAACRSWLASARHPRFGTPYPQTVYQPMRPGPDRYIPTEP